MSNRDEMTTMILTLLLIICHDSAIVPVGPRSAVESPLFASTTTPEPPKTLPQGRRTPKFLNFCFDDTLSLLHSKTTESYQVNRKRKFGSIYKTHIFFRPAVFCASDDTLQELRTQESVKSLEAFFPPHHQLLFGPHSLLVQSGKTHACLRRLIQPSLSPTVIESYCRTIEGSIDLYSLTN